MVGAGVAEQADAADLKSAGARLRVGSNPIPGTKFFNLTHPQTGAILSSNKVRTGVHMGTVNFIQHGEFAYAYWWFRGMPSSGIPPKPLGT